MKHQLAHPKLLKVACPDKIAMGGSQDWYAERWPRLAGCGPTAASNIIWYMARSRPELRSLCDIGSADKAHFVKLMSEMFTYVTPGLQGVNTASIFANGVVRYASAHGAALTPCVLEIDRPHAKRPGECAVCEFILNALEADAPVAFLNLSNGSLDNLEGWHWVTIIELDTESMTAGICDQGSMLDIDLIKWLETSKLGGALVYLKAN